MNTKDEKELPLVLPKKYGHGFSNCQNCGLYRPTEKGLCGECVKSVVMTMPPDFEYDNNPERCNYTLADEDDFNRQCHLEFGHNGNHETVPITRCDFADFADRMPHVQCCLQMGHRGEHKQPALTRCIVLNCANTDDLGAFVGDICDPCYVFITKGEGRHSQAYRNALNLGAAGPSPETLSRLWRAVNNIMIDHRSSRS